MGEVYRARDLRLKRDVALKVLPTDVIAAPERLARFQREAEVLASLNHPHIAQLYGLEVADPAADAGQGHGRALVLELVEGPTLDDRIGQGAIPFEEARPIAVQIADAHEHGIVRRDLKPANIELTADGVVKALDQGSGIRGRSEYADDYHARLDPQAPPSVPREGSQASSAGHR